MASLTVVMPAHNSASTIVAAIESVLCQSYPDFELWVLENGSSDRTLDVARSFTDPRVKVFDLGSIGFQESLAFALENSQAEWLARMDADDLIFPDRFKIQMEAIEEHPEVVLVGTQRAYLTPFGHIFEPTATVSSRHVGHLNLRLKGEDRKFFIDASVIFNRSFALEVGGYDPEFEMGDVPLWFRILSKGEGWEIAEPLYLYRLNPKSMSFSKTKQSDQSYRLVRKYAPQLLPLYAENPASSSNNSEQSFWFEVAKWEYLAGDHKSVLQAADFLEQEGPFEKKANQLRWLVRMGLLGRIIYGIRMGKSGPLYRHRPDWEEVFTSLVGSLDPVS